MSSKEANMHLNANSNTHPRLTLSDKIGYFIGYLPDSIMNNAFFSLIMMAYNLELGVAATSVGLAMSLPRLWEAFIDPYFGNMSDNTRSRFGRRKPFMVAGAILGALFCIGLWAPPSSLKGDPLFYYLMVMSFLYFTAYAIYSVPFMALGLGMATDKNDRDSLMGWRVASNCFVNCLIAPFLMSAVYRTATTFDTSNTKALAMIGCVLGLMILVAGLLAAKLVREPSIVEHSKSADHGLLAGFKASLTSIPFLMVTAIVSLTVIGLCAASSLGMYLNLTIIYPVDGVTVKTLEESKNLSADMVGISGSIGAGVALVFAFMVAPLSKRFGRKPVLLAALIGIIGTFVCSPLLYTKAMPSLQIIFSILNQICVTCVWVLTLPMLADVCDYDEIKTGVRREGVFTAMYNWGIKVAISMIGVCAGLAITFSGFNSELINQAPRTAEILRWVFALGPVPFFIICIILTITFPLTPEKIQVLREEMNKK